MVEQCLDDVAQCDNLVGMNVRLAENNLKTKFGDYKEVLYYNGQKESIALVMGDVNQGEDVLCRIHSSCINGHVFSSIECDCREQLERSQEIIQQHGKGIVIWLDQEGKGNGHFAVMKTGPLKAKGLKQGDAYKKLGFKEDARDFTPAADILKDLGVQSIRMLTDNSAKTKTMTDCGVVVSGTTSLSSG